MSQLEFDKIYLQLELELHHETQFSDSEYSLALKDAVLQSFIIIRPELDQWLNQLRDRTISCNHIEMLLESKRNEVSIDHFRNLGVEDDKLEIITDDILRLIAKSIMNFYLDASYRNRKHLKHTNIKEDDWF